MKRKILFIIGAIVLALVVVAGGFWYMSTQPLYKPGMVREMGAALTPPSQPVEGQKWLVESTIELNHFDVGEG